MRGDGSWTLGVTPDPRRPELARAQAHAPRGLGPKRAHDAARHHHILDTRCSAADCQRIFGGFLYHDPGLSGMELNDAWMETYAAYHAHFDDDTDMRLGELGRLPAGCG